MTNNKNINNKISKLVTKKSNCYRKSKPGNTQKCDNSNAINNLAIKKTKRAVSRLINKFEGRFYGFKSINSEDYNEICQEFIRINEYTAKYPILKDCMNFQQQPQLQVRSHQRLINSNRNRITTNYGSFTNYIQSKLITNIPNSTGNIQGLIKMIALSGKKTEIPAFIHDKKVKEQMVIILEELKTCLTNKKK